MMNKIDKFIDSIDRSRDSKNNDKCFKMYKD